MTMWIQDGVREGLPYYREATRRERIRITLASLCGRQRVRLHHWTHPNR